MTTTEGKPPRSADDPATAWRDTCTASPCERASHFPPKKFSSPGHKGNHETPDTRRARRTSSPSVPPDRLSPPHLARSSPVARGKRAARVRWELSPAHKKPLSSATAGSQKEHTARVRKHCHNLSYALPTAAGVGGLKTALIRNTRLV